MRCRTEPLAAVTVPVLELEGRAITLGYLRVGGADHNGASAVAESADLPVGFRPLWLRTSRINLGRAAHLAGATLADISSELELCWFLSLAPECYQEFRLFNGPGSLPLSVQVEWQRWPNRDETACCMCMWSFASWQAVAASMQRCADAHGLAVSISDDQSHVQVVRLQPPSSPVTWQSSPVESVQE